MEKQILELYSKYRNGGIVAKELGITNYKVYKCLRENKIKINKVGGKEKVSLKRLIKLHNKGLNNTEIAKKLHMSAVSVWERLTNAGVKFNRIEALKNKLQKIPEIEHDNIVQMYQDGMWGKDIAKQYKVSGDTIMHILNKKGINIRDNRGSNNKSWRGGITPLHTRIRNSDKYIKWRSEIFKERDYVCQLSGQRGGRINVHHIQSFSEILSAFLKVNIGITDENQLFELALNYQEFWDKSNTIVISEDIHNKIHGQQAKLKRQEKVEIIKKLALLGWSKQQIYNFLHMSSHTLEKIIKENGDIQIISVSERQTIGIDKELLKDLVNKGYSDRAIGKQLGVAHTTIKRYKRLYKLI